MSDQTAGLDQAGSNLTALKKDIAEGIAKINQYKAERTSCNEEISAIRETLAAKGIPKKALDMAIQYMNMDPDKREGFDAAYGIVREAVGLPYKAQGDLFAHTDEAQDADIASQMDDGDGDDNVVPMAGETYTESDPDQEEFDAEVDAVMGDESA